MELYHKSGLVVTLMVLLSVAAAARNALPAAAVVSIRSIPPGAQVRDESDRSLGVTPLNCSLDAHISHQLRFSRAGYATRWERLDLGQTVLEVTLAPTSAAAFLDFNFRYRPAAAWPVAAGLVMAVAGGLWMGRRHIRRLERDLVALQTSDLNGQTVGDYRMLRLLGEGMFSQVWLAEHLHYHDAFAVKMLRGGSRDAEMQRRFFREMEIGRDMQHANLVRVFGFGEHEGAPYIVMELVKGQTLSSRLQDRPLDPDEAVDLFRQVCAGLSYLHRHQVVHRDLKPDNIMLLPDRTVKIMDYGVAKLTDRARLTLSGATLGTPHYMSPEHLNAALMDARSDIYSLGVIMYEMLTGRLPFSSDSAFGTIRQHLTRRPQPLRELNAAISPELEALVLKMLEKQPERRFASVEAVLDALPDRNPVAV